MTSASFKPSHFMKMRLGDGDSNNELDEQSVTFSVDPDMHKKLDIKKPRKGEEYSTYEADKMYQYQLDRDIKKLVKVKGSYQQRSEKFKEIRQSDPDYAKLAKPKALGDTGNFVELLQYTSRPSWQLTSKPYGEIAHKRYLEYLANLPKGPTEEEIRDKEQRKLDQELWTKVITGRLDLTKREIRAREIALLKQEALERGEIPQDEYGDDYGEDDLASKEIVMTRDEERRMHYKNGDFEKTRSLPTRREFDKSMNKWHKGLYYPYNTDKGFPYVTITSKDDKVIQDIKEGEAKQRVFTSQNILKDRQGADSRWSEYRGRESYNNAKQYLDRLHEKEMKKKVKEAGKGVKPDRVRRGGKRSGEIATHLAKAQLLAPLKLPNAASPRSSSSSSSGSADEHEEDRECGVDLHFGEGKERNTMMGAPLMLAGMLSSFFSRSGKYKVSPHSTAPAALASHSKVSFSFRGIPIVRYFLGESDEQIKERKRKELRRLRNVLTPPTPTPSSLMMSVLAPPDTTHPDPPGWFVTPVGVGVGDNEDRKRRKGKSAAEAMPGEEDEESDLKEMTWKEYMRYSEKKKSYFEREIRRQALAKSLTAAQKRNWEMLQRRYDLFLEEDTLKRQRYDQEKEVYWTVLSILKEREAEVADKVAIEKAKKAAKGKDKKNEKVSWWKRIRGLFGSSPSASANSLAVATNSSTSWSPHLPPILVDFHQSIVLDLMKQRVLEKKRLARKRFWYGLCMEIDVEEDYSKKTGEDLAYAAENGDYRMVFDLLDKREKIEDEPEPLLSPDAKNMDGITPMYSTLRKILALQTMGEGVLGAGVSTGALGFLKSNKGGIDMPASNPKYDLTISVLLAYGGKVVCWGGGEAGSDRGGERYAPIHLAAMAGGEVMLDWLLQLGHDNNRTTANGAVAEDNKAYTNLPTSPTKSTPLMLAAERNHLHIVMLLLRYGAAQGAALLDAQGNNCLHYAARGGASLTLVKVLLMCGCPNVRNQAGQLPGEICRSKMNFDASAAISEYSKLSGGSSGNGGGAVSGTADERIEFLYRYEVLGDIREEAKEQDEEEDNDEELEAKLVLGRTASVKVNRMWGMQRPASAPPTSSSKSSQFASVKAVVGNGSAPAGHVAAGKKRGLIQKSFMVNTGGSSSKNK